MKSSKVSIGLVNPKSPDNVNSVMRAAGNFRVDSVFYTGKRYPRALMRNPGIPDMSRQVGQQIPLSEVVNFADCGQQNMKLVCVEFAENAIALPEFKHPQNAIYVFGPEDGNLEQDLIDQADAVVYIPTVGCMNMAATVSVLLYDRLSKSMSAVSDNNLIRQSRDTNNRLKVKEY